MKDDSTLITHSPARGSAPRSHTRYLVQAIQLEEEGGGSVVKLAIFAIALFFGAAISWASFTPVSEVTSAPGEVVPSASIYEVKHLRGGTIEAMAVRNGASVEKDQILMSLAPRIDTAELERLLTRRTSLRLQLERLQAILEHRRPDFTRILAMDERLATQRRTRLASRQHTIWLAQTDSLASELAIVDSQINQREQELKRQKEQVDSIRKEVRLANQQADIRRNLVEEGVVSRADLLSTLSRLAEVQSKLGQATASISVSEGALAEARQRRVETTARFNKENALQAGDIIEQLAELDKQVVSLQETVNRLDIKAPISGIVQDLAASGPGGVIEPGQVIMKIVPTGSELIVEAKIRPQDIGHVHLGQSARIKVTSFDSSRFGEIQGTLGQLSASTYLDYDQAPYYRAEIKLAKSWLGDDPKRMRVLPGMQIQADIQTGSKTIMEYLLKPVTRGFNESFRER